MVQPNVRQTIRDLFEVISEAPLCAVILSAMAAATGHCRRRAGRRKESHFGKALHPDSFSRVVRRLDLLWQKTWPRPPKTDETAQVTFKKGKARCPDRGRASSSRLTDQGVLHG
ncbi:protein of unknown function (plasmid) [Rhodovastum atsumiense]|uniref:winged helix-turn-helix domain-containing protein n=1 Tax=Rhodovastum atsumiense TaxID=504468 RepID=UPI0020241978|nr:winged helix-turn-helix domain-containing protein [Rhodovastum atsumiense]CAH2605423.1 protein of unknown function [Rhodovastum atsumiense]